VTDTADLLRSLAAGISHTSEEAKHQNKIQCKQLNYIKEKDAKKKNTAEKWHPTS
jgi:ABC-type branched-subunit amino acid transport system substrate-binding protein